MTYADGERREFLEVAANVGPHRAREQLGYPGRRTATRWMEEEDGLDWGRAVHQVRGRALAQAYSDEEQAAVGSLILDRIVEQLLQGQAFRKDHQVVRVPLGPDALLKCAGAFAKVAEQLGLIQGRAVLSASGRHEMDDRTKALLEASRLRNAEILAELEADARRR